MIEFTLPWPAACLSPNARPHWSQKARAVKAARHQAKYTLLEAAGRDTAQIMALLRAGRVHVAYEFVPKDRRRRDLDNALAATKATTDGIADALAMDDSRFEISARMASDKAPKAHVRVRLSAVAVQ